MPLSMTRPWKHPDTGMYWFRRAVPADLRALVGKREEKRSLQTKDPSTARQRHAEVLAEVEARWSNLRQGQRSFSESDVHALAAAWHDKWIEQHRENPSTQEWPTSLADRMWKPSPPLKVKADGSIDILAIDSSGLTVRDMENWCRDAATRTLKEQGLVVDEDSQLKLAKAIGYAIQRASLTLAEYAKGNFGFPSVGTGTPNVANPNKKARPFVELVDGWKLERKPALKTVYEWTRVLKEFQTFVGHDDANSVVSEDVIRWKDQMVRDGLRPRTIQNAKLAPLRAILQWGADNRRIEKNPAERVSVEIKTPANERKRSFTEEEAVIILRGARTEQDPVRRWVPWLGAYSGARVSELCQLRRQDIVQVDTIWCMKMDPEAGSLKTEGSERLIPLHPALIEEGFLTFVQTIKAGPLFPKLSPDKFGKRGGNGTKVIGRWVRSLGLTDQRISPSHSWRHRIKTLGRRHGLAQDILEAITGHGRRTVADNYGEYPVEALHRELSKIPMIVI